MLYTKDVCPERVYTLSPSSVHTRISLQRVSTSKAIDLQDVTYLSFEQEAKPMSGMRARPRTACVCPLNVLTFLW